MAAKKGQTPRSLITNVIERACYFDLESARIGLYFTTNREVQAKKLEVLLRSWWYNIPCNQGTIQSTHSAQKGGVYPPQNWSLSTNTQFRTYHLIELTPKCLEMVISCSTFVDLMLKLHICVNYVPR